MNLEIPEGANIQIFVGTAQPLWLADHRDEMPVNKSGRGIAGALLKCVLIGGLVIGGYVAGQFRYEAANAEAGFPAPPPVSQAFPSEAPGPSQAAAQPPAPDAGQMPPNFQETLQQPPTIQPPPGQNTSAPNGNKNPFGLQD
jgi:hypothetical protein